VEGSGIATLQNPRSVRIREQAHQKAVESDLAPEPLQFHIFCFGDLLQSFLKGDAQCDLPYRKVLPRTAPGDPMAILPESLGYQPKLEKTPQPDEVLPCYRTAKR
jgi:hypothetical protein